MFEGLEENPHSSVSNAEPLVEIIFEKGYQNNTYRLKSPFTFSSYPKALHSNLKVTNNRPNVLYHNVMYDRRIYRGSTYALPVQTTEDYTANTRIHEARKKALARRQTKKKPIMGRDLRLKSPPPVAGRRHEPVQTDTFLELIWSNPPTSDANIQTDLIYDRPISPLYTKPTNVTDVETQINVEDLIDMDSPEIQCFVQAFINTTIEEALLAVVSEEDEHFEKETEENNQRDTSEKQSTNKHELCFNVTE